MKYILMIATFFFLTCAVQGQTAEQIIDKAEKLIKGKTSVGTFTMRVTTPDYTRTVKMKAWNDGTDKALIETLSPRKEKGNKMLKIDNQLWSYLKNTEMTMKLPASMMLQSWNGSDLTNDDLVRESELTEDYSLKKLADETVDGQLCYKIELLPKPNAPVVWGRLYYCVRKSDNLPWKTQFFDEKGKLHRSMLYRDIKKMSGRTIPTKWVIVNEKKKNRKTEFIYNDVKFDVKIPDRIFSFRELEK
ncbi:MAG: outer membrane lipoprotein-sorting protein [Candidatus Kapabacteria bacterium]|jgi:outer membrane lipoprotein-sorting protein|nr:outer membrane lipoprotein-sorting protein [Candidatus Kapabacteria bacterium]